MQSNKLVNFSEILDGTSNTTVFFECAMRPIRHKRGGKKITGGVGGAGWADQDNSFSIDGYSPDCNTRPFECAVNCCNRNEIYAFHSGGANVGVADGSVRFLQENVSLRVVARLATRAGGEATAE
jgi:prepilin-type processing-associated H-X9-DG protein